jgi:hypothetical protein
VKPFLQALVKALSGKSKTINLNTVITALIIWHCHAHQIDLSTEDAMAITAALYCGLNIVLRFLTNLPLAQKGGEHHE